MEPSSPAVVSPSGLSKRHRILCRKASEKFFINQREGLVSLVESGIMRSADDPAEVARIFHSVEGLSKRKVGDFLSQPEDFNQAVLQEWLSQLTLGGLDLDEALRVLVAHTWLAGEAQKIDRVMEQFAKEYVTQNPSSCLAESEDAAFVLAFSLIMLSTDQHNPHVKGKMTCADFVRNYRGVGAGGNDLPQGMLEQIFHRIQTQPFRMHEDDVFESDVPTFVAPVKCGWLEKLPRGGGSGAGSGLKRFWPRPSSSGSSFSGPANSKSGDSVGAGRPEEQASGLKPAGATWFLLTDGCLYSFASRADKARPRSIVPLEKCAVSPSRSKADVLFLTHLEPGKRLQVLRTFPSGSSSGSRASSSQLKLYKKLVLRAPSPSARDEWVVAFEDAIQPMSPPEPKGKHAGKAHPLEASGQVHLKAGVISQLAASSETVMTVEDDDVYVDQLIAQQRHELQALGSFLSHREAPPSDLTQKEKNLPLVHTPDAPARKKSGHDGAAMMSKNWKVSMAWRQNRSTSQEIPKNKQGCCNGN